MFAVPYLYLQNVTKTAQSAYMNDKSYKNNKLREIRVNDVDTPSLSVQKSNYSTMDVIGKKNVF